MPHLHKVATCCYCGSRAALVLSGNARHELACANCGAPLHELKRLRTDARGERELVHPSPIRGTGYGPTKHRAPKRRPRRLSLSQRFMEQLIDAVEDLADEVFDVFD